MQLQAYAACEDEDVREAVREEFLRLVRFVQSASGAPDEAIRPWLAVRHAHERRGRHGPRRSRRGLGPHVHRPLMLEQVGEFRGAA